MGLADSLLHDNRLVSTAAIGLGYAWHLLPPTLGDVLALPIGAGLIAEIQADAAFLAEARALPEAERRRDLELFRAGRRQDAPVWEELVALRAVELEPLRRLAWHSVRAATYPETRDGQLVLENGRPVLVRAPCCLTSEGQDGWPAPPSVQRLAVEELRWDHLHQIAIVATLGAIGALQRAVSLSGDGGAVGGSPDRA